jgi:uncharacterized phage protein (TIGR02218 family)
MSITVNEAIESLRTMRTHRFATLWEIERTDSTILRFTDHSQAIEFGGEDFSPLGGFNSSAQQVMGDLSERNLEVVGILSDSSISDDDLRAGLYREAKITATLVDWRYPWAGTFVTNVYWITELQFSGERWEAKVEGLTRWLNPRVGHLYDRLCRWTLGDSNCKFALGPATESGTVGSVTTARRVFVATGIVKADDFHTLGKLTWTGAGANSGLVSEIKLHAVTGGPTHTISLQLPTPYDIEATDPFTIIAGCDKTVATCIAKFDILENFGGFPFMPGNDRMLQTPRAR